MQGISLLAENRLVSQEGHCSMELVKSYYNLSMCDLTLHIIIIVILSATFLEKRFVKMEILRNSEI